MNNSDNSLYFDKKDFDIYFMLGITPLLLSLYYYFGYGSFLKTQVPYFMQSGMGDVSAYITQFAVFFILMFIIPASYVKFKMHADFKDFGLGFGDYKKGLKLVLIFAPVVAAVLYFGSAGADVRTEYPLAKSLHEHRDLIFIYHLSYVVLYYIAWEFFFRGFLLFGLKDRFGVVNAILIQTMASCLIHLGKPAGETIGAIFVGIIFGIFAYRTRSIWYVFLLHILMGLLTDLYIIFFHGPI